MLNQKATLWQSGTAIDLNTLKDPTSGVGWTLLEAQAISDDGNYITGIGKLVGNGIVNGERHAFLLKKLITEWPSIFRPGRLMRFKPQVELLSSYAY